jgi:N-acetylmuramoyl-L-alanine amidase
MKRSTLKKSILTAVLIFCMAVVYVPFAGSTVNAEDSAAAADNGASGTVQAASDEGSSKTAESATYAVSKSTYTGRSASTAGGTVTLSASSVKSGGSLTVTSKPKRGYSIRAIYVNGKKVSSTASVYTVSSVDQNTYVKVYFWRSGLFIKLDPGHAGYYNRGYYKSYYESVFTYKFYKRLRYYLEQYPSIAVSGTKTSLNNDPLVYTRGLMAKGYDLFISLHSNSGARSANYPLAIVSSGSVLQSQAKPLSVKLAQSVQSTMGTSQSYQIWQKKQKDGRDWYGVIRGSAAVGVPGIILEHSFHSNPRSCRWLLNSTNINRMAKNEATVIANHYGMTKSRTSVLTPKKTALKLTAGSRKVAAAWKSSAGAYGYRLYRSTSANGKYTALPSTRSLSCTDKYLVSGKTYYYKVRAYRYYSGIRVYGAYSSVAAVRVK